MNATLGSASICFALLLASTLPAQVRNLGVVGPPASAVHVVAFGDWGYQGTGSGQAAVAAAVRKIHESVQPFHIGLTLGDNFYPSGVRSVSDPLWGEFWERGYARLGIPFFATLGNHDYSGKQQAEIDYTGKSTTWRMPFNYYTFQAGPVQFFALDTDEGTTGVMHKLFRVPWGDGQAKWLEAELARSNAPWKIVYGHHPIYSDGSHGNEARLLKKLLPILLRHHVDIYLAGHEHDLQFHQHDGMQFLIAGGGGKDTRGITMLHAQFAASQHGFLDLTASATQLQWHLRSVEGKSLQSQTLRPKATTTAPARTRTAPTSQRR